MYTLAGIVNPETGWGLAGDSFQMLDMLARYGAEPWFRLGDRDLATHLLRTEMLRAGHSLTDVTAHLCRALGVGPRLLPMSDDRVATIVLTDEGRLEFQEYFVRRRWQPVVREIVFDGLEVARPSPAVLEAVCQADAIVVCPSNPYVSLDPILALPGLREAIRESPAAKVGISGIIGGEAVKGPAAKIMRELGEVPAAHVVASRYADILDAFFLDTRDPCRARTYPGPWACDRLSPTSCCPTWRRRRAWPATRWKSAGRGETQSDEAGRRRASQAANGGQEPPGGGPFAG